ncbi:MAG: SDR family oxidoreductase, partial [Nocardioides sp.]
MTGYPADLLDPDLDLEADLGVDTVKQAEVFAAVRAQWNLERDDTLQLREFPTLNHVAGWVHGKLGTSPDGTVAMSGSAASGATTTASAAAPQTVVGDLDAVDAFPRRVPVPSLRPPADQCLATGVSLRDARVVVMRDEGGVGDALVKRLRKAGATALVLDPGTPTDEVLAQLAEWTADGPVTGVYWLAALDDEGDLAAYDLAAWHEALRRRVKALYATMRHLWEDDAFLVAATRLGGYHGYSAAGAASALGGAVTGFTKSYKKERPGALVKAVDLPVDRRTAAVADLLIEETLRDPGCVEVGRVDGRRFGIALLEQPFPARGDDGAPHAVDGMPLTSDSVVLVTGAAGSIVSAITADLAAASGGVFHLLDLTPAPNPGDADIAAFRSDRTSLKETIAARMKERGDRPTPEAIDREVAHIERLEAALTCVEAVEAAGGTAYYYPVDLTDAAAVGAVMDQVRERSGRVDVLLHAAGVEISRNLPEKEPQEFDLVFDVKTTGWFNVWQAARQMDVGAVVAFSSVAGRFGNNGQTDYAAGNDLLCKVVASMRATRPQTRGLALDWTAWGGIGMATRGSIPKIMEMAGVQVLPPEAGVAWIRRELTSSGYSGEVVVAGALGMMAAEYHESGGLDADVLREQHPFGPMVGEVGLSVHDGVVSRVTLDPARQRFLDDHRIDGIPVLPGVMGMEAFAEVAGLVAPAGYRVDAVEEVGFLAPVKFYRDEPRTLTVSAVTAPDPEGGEDLVAHCTLTAERRLPGSEDPVRTTHFTGRVRLTGLPVEEERSDLDRAAHEPVVNAEQVYRFYFHGPAYQVVETAWRDGDGPTARLPESLPDDRSPADAPLSLAPRLVELCFQTAGLWEAAREDRLALPMSVGRVCVLLDQAS